MRRDSNRAIATDHEGHELRVNDNMKEIDGEVSLCDRVACIAANVAFCRVGKDAFCIHINRSSHSSTVEISQRMAVSL